VIGAFCFGELGRRRPRAGGGYVYLRETWGPLPAFLYGWALLLVIATGAIAAVAVTFANYALALAGLSARLTVPVAIGAIALVSGINYVGVKPAAVTQNVFTLLKLAALAVLIVAGLAFAVPSTALHRPPPPFTAPVGMWGVAVTLGAALVPILFTYGGWQRRVHLRISEPRDPRDAARAAGDGGGWRVPAAARRPAPPLPHARARHPGAGRLGDCAHALRHVRSAGGLRGVRGLDFFRSDRGGALHL